MKKFSLLVIILGFTLGCKEQAVPEEITNNQPATEQPAVVKKIAAWGDSFTHGGGITMPEFAYPVQLQKISGYEVYNGGIGGQTSTQIKARMLAATDKKDWAAIIWAGSNNFWAPQIVKADIAEMVAFLGHKRFLVLPILNDATERKGSSEYMSIMKLNSDLKAAYPENYLDVRAYLLTLSNGSAQDEKDVTDDVIPSSLRSDESHLNDKSYPMLAAYIYKNFPAIHQ